MAVVVRHPTTVIPGSADSAFSPAFMQFFAEVCSTPTVQRFGIFADDSLDGWSVWVRLDQDDEDQEERVYRALQAYRATEPEVGVDLHVVFPEQPDAVFPENAVIVYTRP